MKAQIKKDIIKYPPVDYRKLRKYKNQWVALQSDGKTVISHGKDMGKVLDEAWAKGVKEPHLMHVPTNFVSFLAV